jgi:hypothetical protein
MTFSNNVARGIRNNNPGNIRHSNAHWQGMSVDQPDSSFITFNSPESGIRAMAVILLNYQRKHNLNNVQSIINRWAPPSENNTRAYVNAVAHRCGVRPDQTIDLNNSMILGALVSAVILHENGSNPYDVDAIRRGVQQAVTVPAHAYHDRSHRHVRHHNAAGTRGHTATAAQPPLSLRKP